MEKELGAARINVQFATLSLAEIEDFLHQFGEYGNTEIIPWRLGHPSIPYMIKLRAVRINFRGPAKKLTSNLTLQGRIGDVEKIVNFIRKFLRQELFNGKHPLREVTRIKNAQIYAQKEENTKREPSQSSNEEAQWNSNSWNEREKSKWQPNGWEERERNTMGAKRTACLTKAGNNFKFNRPLPTHTENLQEVKKEPNGIPTSSISPWNELVSIRETETDSICMLLATNISRIPSIELYNNSPEKDSQSDGPQFPWSLV